MTERAESTPSLEVYHEGVLVFASAARWLHPLLELERFLGAGGPPVRECRLRDRIVGRAAALLEVRLGFREIHAGLLSELGEEVFRRHGVSYTCGARVARIACKTEDLLATEWDLDRAWMLVTERARLARAARA